MPAPKLSPALQQKIKGLKPTQTNRVLAERFGVSSATIWRILHNYPTEVKHRKNQCARPQ